MRLENKKTENDFLVDIILGAYTFSTVCAELDLQQNDYVFITRDLCVLGGIGRTRIDRTRIVGGPTLFLFDHLRTLFTIRRLCTHVHVYAYVFIHMKRLCSDRLIYQK